MYEGLLAYTPRYHADERTFTLDVSTGNDRKKSGSYYTPSDLIALVLDEALDPLIDEALAHARTRNRRCSALTVVDPACGSGHFVVAAARRIAAALATVRTGDTEPSPAAPTRRHRRRHRTLRLRRRPQRPGHRDHQGRAVAGSLRRRPAVPVPGRPLPRRQRAAGHHPGAAAPQHPRRRVRGPRRRRQGRGRPSSRPATRPNAKPTTTSSTFELRARDPQRRNQPIHQGRPRSRRRHRGTLAAHAGPRRRVARPGSRPRPGRRQTASPTRGARRSCSPRTDRDRTDLRPGHHPRDPARPVREPRSRCPTPSSR